jgi:MFS family permease
MGVMFDRNFGPYLLGNFASNCGTWFQNIAQALLVYQMTHSTLLVGAVNFAQFIGSLVLAPWAGAAADRFDRRRLLMTVQAASLVVAVALTAIAYTGHAGLLVILIAALLLGLGAAFAIPAMQALVPALVERQDMPAAVAMNTVTFTLARAVGPILGALAVTHLGISAAFGLNASSYLLMFFALTLVRPRPVQAGAKKRRASLRSAWRGVRGDSTSLLMLIVVACVAISGDPVNTLTPEFATRTFHQPATGLGLLIGAFGFGSVIAAFVAKRIGGARGTMAVMFLMGLATIGLGFAVNMWMAMAMLCVAGFGFLAAQTNATVQLQARVSEQERGRVMALWGVAWLGTRPIASLIDGAVADLAGVRAAAMVMALPVLLGLVLFGLVQRAVGQARDKADKGQARDKADNGEVRDKADNGEVRDKADNGEVRDKADNGEVREVAGNGQVRGEAGNAELPGQPEVVPDNGQGRGEAGNGQVQGKAGQPAEAEAPDAAEAEANGIAAAEANAIAAVEVEVDDTEG